MAGATMLVHVTHIDDSIQGRQGPCVFFWGMTHDRSLYLLMEKYLESIRHYLETSTPPLDLNVLDQVCCVLINHQWHRARILEPKLSHAGTVEVFCIDSGDNHSVPLAFVRTLDFPGHEVEHIREWPPLASKFILADMVAPRGPGSRTQWSEPAMMFLKIHVENRTWKAAPMGMYGENQGVRLFDSNNQLLATLMIQQGLGLASQTYHDALHMRDVTEKPPAYMKPALTIGQMGGNGPIVNNRLPPSFAIPSTYRDQHPAFAMAASYSPKQSPVPPRAFVTNDIPLKGRHDVIVTHIPDGPQKFYVQLKSEAKDLQSLRKKLDSLVPHPLRGTPQPGTPCIGVSSVDKLFHRGLITAVRECGNQCNCSVYFADIGTQEPVSLTLICNIPDDLLLPRLFAYRVSLFGVEEVLKLTGLNEIFTALVKSVAGLQIEVVEDDEGNQKVNLYDTDGRSFREVLVSIYSNFLTSKSQTTSPSTAQPSTVVTTCVTDIAPVQLAVEESLCLIFVGESGCFFGQFEKTPVNSLHEMATELMKAYSSNPNSALLYADVRSHLGHYGVFLWEEDYKFYRVRITKEMVNDAGIHFIDYGNCLVVPRCKILAPLESLTRFYHPPYGIRCRLEGEVTLSASEWTTAIVDKSIKVKIGECDNGIYSVTLTKDPCNEDIMKMVSKKVAPICNVVNSTPAVGIRSSSPQTVADQLIAPAEPSRPRDDRRKRNGDNGNFGRIHYQHPNAKDSNWRSAGTEEGSPSVQTKPPNKETNWRTSANPIQEVIRAPRGPPPSTGNGETKGPVGFQRLGATEPSQPPVVKPIVESPPTVPAIPKPVTPVRVQKQLNYPMQVLAGASKPVEMACVVDPSSFYVRLTEDYSLLTDMIAKLNAVYSDETQPWIQNAKVGSACVVQYIEDNQWYRGKILESNDSSLTIPQVSVLFVDYGNTQLCPPEQVKYIDKAFVQQPPLVFHCKLKGVEGCWTDEDVAKFNACGMFKSLTATFTACDSDDKYPIRLIVENEGATTVINDLFGAKTSVPPPSGGYTYLPVSETPVEMTIAWYHNPGRIFISPVDLTSYQSILGELEQFYLSMPPDELVEDQPKVGLPCVARFTEDQCYYRSRILTIQDDIAKVLFVDFGNEQDTPLSQLKRILPRFMFPQLTWHSKLKGVKKLTSGPPNPDPQKHIAACFSIGQTLSAVFHPVAQDNNGVFEVDLIVPGIGDVAQYLIKQKILDSIPSEIHTELAVQIMNFIEGQIISTHAIAPHVISATEFWVHFDPESVEAFMERIDALALDAKFINAKDYNATVGKPCLAYFADDGRWYRAIVESVDVNSATVYYVDYGNSCIVNTSDLRALPVEVSQQPAFAYKCCVDGAEAFTEEVAMAFQTSILELAFSVQCVNVIEGMLKVRLYSTDGVDLMEQLCNAHLNQPTIEQLPVESVVDVALPTTETQGEVIAEETVHVTCPVIEDGLNQNVCETPQASTSQSDLKEQMDHVKVYISYSISPNQFWLQLRQNDDKLSEMLDEMAKIYQMDRESFLIQGQPVINQIYGVLHPSYGDWYRGRVKGISENIAEVHFVDYGDTYSVPIGDILELPQQFSNIPAMAIEGSLSVDSSEAVAEKFNAVCFEPDQIHWALFGTDENGLQFVKSLFIGDTNVLDLMTVQEPVVVHYNINLSTIPEALIEQSVQTSSADDTNMDLVHPEDVSFSSALNVEAEIKIEDHSSVDLNGITPLDLNFAPGQRISSCASISYIESPTEIWLQLDPTAVDNLMNEMAAVYPSTLAAAKPVVGNHCLALFPVDGQWYRAVITETDMGSDEVRVTYVDYGNSSIVNVGDLRVLPVHFAEQPILALKCALDGIDGNVISSPSTEQCMSVLEEEVLTVVFSSSTSDCVYVRLFDVTGSDLNEKLGLAETLKTEVVGTNLSEITPFDDVEMASPLPKMVESAVFNLVSGQSVVPPEVVTHSAMAGGVTAGYSAISNAELVDGAQQVSGETTTETFLQNTGRHENETEVMDRLQSVPVENIGESLTLATAEELEKQEAKVVCNMEETAVKEDDLTESCIQVAVGFEEDLGEPVVDVMQETAVEEDHFDASLVLVAAEDSENQETEVVENTQETSIEQNDLVESPIQVSTGYSEIEEAEIADTFQQVVTIENDFADSFSHSIDSFICEFTLEPHVELKENEVREQLTILEQEMACADDGTRLDMQEYSSNQTITESINLEQNESVSADVLVQCSITSSADLHPSEELPVIEDSALFELETTEEVGTSIPTCEAVEENVFDEQIVLRMKSEVVSEEEGDQVPKGNVYVSHVVSPGDFWIQKIEHADVIGDVDNQLLDMNLDSHELVEQFVVGNIFAAKHQYYGYWYRAKLLKVEDTIADVIFIDYGDTQTVPALDIRQLPPMLKDVAPMALHCKLAALHLVCWPEKTIKVMKDSCQPEDICRATFRDEVDGIVEVESLFLGDFDVVRAVLSSLVCGHESSQQPHQEPISSQQGESYSETPQLDAHLFLIRVEPGTVKTSRNLVDGESSLPVD